MSVHDLVCVRSPFTTPRNSCLGQARETGEIRRAPHPSPTPQPRPSPPTPPLPPQATQWRQRMHLRDIPRALPHHALHHNKLPKDRKAPSRHTSDPPSPPLTTSPTPTTNTPDDGVSPTPTPTRTASPQTWGCLVSSPKKTRGRFLTVPAVAIQISS